MVPGMRTPTEPNASGGLVRDDRGAILVVAVFMAAFLVGSLWYVIGIGDACLYRDRMQDGADAAAYAAAVYHARGMNIIAMINIIMAGLLAILVALKILQLFNNIANTVLTAICAIEPWGAWACFPKTFTTELKPPIKAAVNGYQRLVNKALPALSKTQKGVAIAMPWVAEAKAVYVAAVDYEQPVEGGAVLSVSLIPASQRLGLPVQKDQPNVLCKKAGQYVADVVFAPFGPIKGIVKGIVGGLTGTFTGYFCNLGGVGVGGSQYLHIDINKFAAQQLCQREGKQKAQENQSFDMNQCLNENQSKVSQAVQQQQGKYGSLSGGMSSDDATPKRVYIVAKNGDDYFHVWSLVVGDSEWPKRADKGVEIASWGQGMVTPPSGWGKIGFAEAEFYDAQRGRWWHIEPDAMWHMYWRARLRRVRPPLPDVGGLLGNKLGQKLTQAVGDKVAKALADSSFAKFLMGAAGANMVFTEFSKVLRGAGGEFDNALQNAVMSQYDKIGVIH